MFGFFKDPNHEVPKPKKKPGRKMKVTLANLRTMKRALDRNPFLTARRLRSEHRNLQHLAESTVRRVIRSVMEHDFQISSVVDFLYWFHILLFSV